MRKLAISISVAATLAFAPVAGAASVFVIKGGGNGHGIGLSQYGAYGFALHGKDYRFILAHFFQGTALATTNPGRVVRVLIGTGTATFNHATRAGRHKLKAGVTYSVQPQSDGSLVLVGPNGKRVGRFGAPLRVTGPGPLRLAGHGAYRGALEFRVSGSAIQTVDAVGLDDYVRGVIGAEMPPSWAQQALDAQAVAARTYAITSNVRGNGYQLYPDTRSQMYGGVSAETPSTDAAVAATHGQIVTYHGAPATTFFFSSSGGYTENIENVWLGSPPQPWLRGVRDPYDGVGGDPYHRWSVRMAPAVAAAKLGSLVQGRFRGIRVTRRGVSPRVVRAQVVGSRGVSSVTGPQLQSIFGLLSTYMSFTTISSAGDVVAKPSRVMLAHLPLPGLGSAFANLRGKVSGSVFPAGRGAAVQLQMEVRHRWRTVRRLHLAAGGRFTVTVPARGNYRILYGGLAGPTVKAG